MLNETVDFSFHVRRSLHLSVQANARIVLHQPRPPTLEDLRSALQLRRLQRRLREERLEEEARILNEMPAGRPGKRRMTLEEQVPP